MCFKGWVKYVSLIILILFLWSCQKEQDIQIETIEINQTTLNSQYDPDTFDLSSIELVIHMSDQSVEKIPLNHSMLSSNDYIKLMTTGTHTITVRYQGLETTLTITMNYSELKTKLHLIYALAIQTTDIPDTYEEWFESICGEDGRSITNASISPLGHLIITYSDDSIDDLGKIIGTDGREVEFDVSDEALLWRYVDDSSWQILIEKSFIQGVGIDDIEINAEGNLIITLTNLETIDLGMIRGYQVIFVGHHGNLIKSYWVKPLSQIIPPDGPIIPGYTFSAWDHSTESITGHMIVKALYTKNTYQINFETNTQEVISPIINIEYENSVVLPIPVYEGHIFIGWYQGDSINSEPFYNTSLVKSNLTLYARYAKSSYTVEFQNLNNETLSLQSISYLESANEPIAPYIAGYSFIGWDNDFISISSDLVIKPIYEKLYYSISFITNIDLALPSITNISYGDSVILPELTRIDYDFLGWYDKGVLCDPTHIMPDEDIILFAQWQRHVYTLSFNSNTGSTVDSSTYYKGDTVSTLPTSTKEGFMFIGWYTDDQVLIAPFTWDVSHDIEAYAIWTGFVDGILYTLYDGYATVSSVPEAYEELIIPDTISGLPITHIGATAISCGTNSKKITLGSNVTHIGDNAFTFCTYLEEVVFGPHTTSIGAYVLDGATSLIHMTISSEAPYTLKHYFGATLGDIPGTLLSIKYAEGSNFINPTLYQNEMLSKTLILPNDMTSIPTGQFMNTPYLKSVILPPTLITIGDSAFEQSGITSISIPNTVQTIEREAFFNTQQLSTLIFEEDSTIHTISVDAFRSSNIEGSLIIPASVANIYGGAFSNTKLVNVSFEEGSQLTAILNHVFATNFKLKSIILPATITSIGLFSFGSSNVLEEIIIPIGVTTIIQDAFSMCPVLTIYAEIDSKPTGWHANFNPNNRPIYWSFEGKYSDIDYDYLLFTTGEAILLGRSDTNTDTNIIIPKTVNLHNVIEIFSKAFDGDTTIETLYIPNTLKKIGTYAFRENTSLISITFEENSQLETIDMYAFYNASSLTGVILPDQLKVIGILAFRNTAITEIVIPNSVVTIDNYAFEMCYDLEVVYFETGSSLQTLGIGVFSRTGVIDIVLPSSLTSIGNYCFQINASLLSVYIPESVIYVGSNLFSNSVNAVIYVQSAVQPTLWNSDWNSSGNTVLWGYLI